ncbi:hypothetical protein V1264_009598 [Littorina saxatilis]|uniref:Coiled-coil domain-containing protein 15 n=1 Tax=Littorina saxatilis TaxID=31220 RepID=A0AAN9AS35_9CAEN
MAADGMTATYRAATLRKVMKPVISSDIMGNRNVEVKPVGAWAEPALCYESRRRMPDAVRAAQREEDRIMAVQADKAAKLRQFQDDVKRRVRQVNKTKHKQLLQKDCEQMEKQHDQVKSSLRASDYLMERKDRVVSHPAAVIPQQPVHAPHFSTDTGGEPSKPGRKKVFEKHNRQVHGFTSAARQKLSGRQVDNRDREETLPGGHWASGDWGSEERRREGAAENHSSQRVDHLHSDSDSDDTDSTEECEAEERAKYFTLPPQSAGRPGLARHTQGYTLPPQSSGRPGHTRHTQGYRSHSDNNTNYTDNNKRHTNNNTNHTENDARHTEDEQDEEDCDEEKDDDAEYEARLQRVRSGLRSVLSTTQCGNRKSHGKKGSRSIQQASSAPDLRSGANEIKEKRRQGQQKLNYLRLYSDLERQAVRDTQRRKQQRAQIRKLKEEKEVRRKQEEDNARRLVEPRDPVTGETSVEADLLQQLERSHLQEVQHEHNEQRQRQLDTTRYLEALRTNLREKMRKQGVELPALCCCGETLWDTHPDTCANNCFYYRNHRAYARALQSLLTSSLLI